MAYSVDMKAAAHRLLGAAQKLQSEIMLAAAAYLFGLAAECALKHMATRVAGCRTDEVLYAHLPELRTLLRDRASGRNVRPLLVLIGHDNYLNGWAIRVRYAPGSEVQDQPIDAWADQAARTVSAMGDYT